MANILLLIGGTGFFGKSFLDANKRNLLNEFGITKIIVIARNIDKFKVEYPELISSNVEFISGDIGTLNELPYADYIIHAATSTNMSDYIGKGEHLSTNNIKNSVSNYCKIASTIHYNSKILYCSSGAVYGKQPIDLETISEDYNFTSDLSELSNEKRAYCLGKRFAENEIIKLGVQGLNVSIARCFAFYGKYLPKDQNFAFGNFIGQAENGEDVVVSSSDIIYRSYMDADDLIISLLLILDEASPICPIYNVGSDVSEALHMVAEKIAIQFGVKSLNNISDSSKVGERYVPNINKLKKLFQTKRSRQLFNE